MRDFLRQFLLYSRSERRAVVALVVLIIIVLLIPRVHRFYIAKPQVFPDTLYKHFATNNRPIDTADIEEDSTSLPIQSKTGTGKTFFLFDPNTANIDIWLRLGLTQKQAQSIEKYKSKGARFYKPDDLRRIYVLSDEMKNRLIPYVRIAKEGTISIHTIEVNSADTTIFKTLRGIKSYRASLIINYRNRLGGFYRIEQIREIPKLPDSVYQNIRPYLTVNTALIHQININDADYETLQKHPYIHAKLANAIINYRLANGKFEGLDQLKTLKPMTDSTLVKISPYLKVKD